MSIMSRLGAWLNPPPRMCPKHRRVIPVGSGITLYRCFECVEEERMEQYRYEREARIEEMAEAIRRARAGR